MKLTTTIATQWYIKFMITLFTIVLMFSSVEVTLQAQSGCPGQIFSVTDAPDEIRSAILLGGEFSEQTGMTAAKGKFHQHSASLTFFHGQRVLLSSSPDGRGALCTDDAVELHVQPSGKTWRHEFPNAARTGIEPIAPVDVTHLFQAGENRVTLTLIDLMSPAFSSSAYYLLVVGTPQPTATPVPPTATPGPINTPTPVPTFPPSPTVTDTPSPIPTWTPQPPTVTPLPLATDTPTQVPTNLPLPTPTVLSAPTTTWTPAEPILVAPTEEGMVQLEVPTEHALSNTAARFPSWSLAMLGLTVMVGLGGVMYAFRGERQRLEGLFLIKDVEGNLVSTVDLSSLGNKASIGREGTVVIPDDESLPIAARVSARRVNDAIEILWQQLDESRTVITEYPLHHGDIEQVGRFVLEYQNFAQEVVDDLMFEEEIWDEN